MIPQRRRDSEHPAVGGGTQRRMFTINPSQPYPVRQGHGDADGSRGGPIMVTNEKQLDIAVGQLESFKGLRKAMRLHLDGTQPTLTATVVEPYGYRIQELQEE